jgi:hypothetical protein
MLEELEQQQERIRLSGIRSGALGIGGDWIAEHLGRALFMGR